MKTLLRGIALISASQFFPISAFSQGSLAPPGSPAPSMKSLDQIEARTPISSLPYTIITQGSYYLTGNLTASGSGAGITIEADNVTLDLNGFALIGGGSGTVAGINVPVAQKNIYIRNGTVRGWTNGGVQAANTSNSILEKLRVSDNASNNGLVAGTGSTIKDCVATDHTNYYGLTAGPSSTVKDCVAASNGLGIGSGDNCTIIGCTASANITGIGFSLGNNVTIVDCTASNGNDVGIAVAARSSVLHCTVSANVEDAIDTGASCTVINCTAAGNGGVGVNATNGCTISGNTVRGNGTGIVVTGGCYISNNLIDVNANDGIQVSGSNNRIEANNCTFNDEGIVLAATGSHNLVIRNTADGNTTANYDIAANNVVGTIVSAPLSVAIKGKTGGAGVGTTDPWANLSY